MKRCAVSGEDLPEAALVRYAIGPAGEVLPDVSARAPGRGVWLKADRETVRLALRRNAFSRSVKTAVTAPPDLADRTEEALAASCLALLGFARRAGDVVMGFDQVTASLRKAQPAFRIEASDGARDGRRKIDALARGVWDGVPVAGCFSGEQIGVALGRDRVIHALVSHGGMANRLAAELRRLSGFRPLVPDSWRSDDG